MTQNFGSGVTRTLSALQRQWAMVTWQGFKPPLDSELNLMAQIELERFADIVRSQMHSGFLLDPLDAHRDFVTDPSWSNFFRFGRTATGETAPMQWANVNGWLIPVTGTAVAEGITTNQVDLWPPPSSDTRIDLVFLEVWLAQVAPNPSTTNKPTLSTVWKWGNVLYGGTNITDDIEDPDIGYETTERVQIQYRLRVYGQGTGAGTSVALDDYPDGLDDPNVLGQGAATSPVTGFSFTNMRDTLGDPGLWRAGNGTYTNDLGTVDGYTYAIPVAAAFRRNTDPFVARETSGNANQNGAVNRNPITAVLSTPAAGTTTLLTASLTNAISEATTGAVQVTNLVGSGLDNANISWTSMFLKLGDEIVSIQSVDTTVSPATMTIRATGGRGRWGTMAVPHGAGTTVEFFNWRHDALFADQIASSDLLDLRKGVAPGEWDYQSLLSHNLSSLFKGELRSSFKQSGIGDTQGPVVVEVDTLLYTGTVPNQTEALDGPDGIRTIWSDAATPQSDIAMLLEYDATQVGGFVTQFDVGVEWDVKPDFFPGGFMTHAGGWDNNAVIFVHIGGQTGSGGARGTFRDGTTRAVRFLGAQEHWKDSSETGSRQTPFLMRFLDQAWSIPAAGTETVSEHPGPMYPLADANFEVPYLVLGGVLNPDMQSTAGVSVFDETVPGAEDWEVEVTGLDFDTAGVWFSKDGSGNFENDPTAVTKPLFHGERTLYGMLTNNGQDPTGASSEVYLVIWGDAATPTNNGAFRVVGAGATAGYTTKSSTAANRVRVTFVSPAASDTFIDTVGLNGEFRSQWTHASDGSGSTASVAALCVVLTDITGTVLGTANPWNSANLAAPISTPITSDMVLNQSIIYSAGRGGSARVADNLDRFAAVTAGSEYLRLSPSSIDSTFPSAAGVPTNETYFDINHLLSWNRLASNGLHAPDAPSFGGSVVSFSEQTRESEVFVDAGSKSLQFRPFLDRSMTLYRTVVGAGTLIPTTYPVGWGGFAVDGAAIFSAGHTSGYNVPPEYMPRFGRQDIPFFVDVAGTGAGTFLQGLNHLFTDSTTNAAVQFNVLGGEDNGGVAGVNPIRIQTGAGSGLTYGQWGAIPSGGGTNGYQGRLYSSTAVISSDLGRGMEGVQLPPFLGLGRVYGVYDLRDYQATGGSTFDTDRITPAAGGATNLLRTDADKQTLFILEGGASDATGSALDHTYILPSDAIDIELSDSFVAGETFSDLDYVVECSVFGFARGWITNNNYVLCRAYAGDGTVPTASTQIEAVHMTIPAAAPAGDQVYMAYNRTVYQGDPFMSRAGSTRTVSDYEHRYGEISQANAFAATPVIQQFDASGNPIPQTSNPRALEILAAVDFWTTMGTGKVSGGVSPGTSLDVGYTYTSRDGAVSTRLPASATEAPFQVEARAFTEGQKYSTNHASVVLGVLDNASLVATNSVTITTPAGTAVALVNPADWAIGANASATAVNIAAAIAANTVLNGLVRVYTTAQWITIVSRLSGVLGNDITVEVNTTALGFWTPLAGNINLNAVPMKMSLQGGVDVATNGAKDTLATTAIKMTGLTERLPLGLLLQDSDFIGEDPLRDGSSQLRTYVGGASMGLLPPTPLNEGAEYSRSVGGVGDFVGMSDGGVLLYTPYNASASPTGSRRFRLYRGGGSLYMISGDQPGGPVDWSQGHMASELEPVVKGAILMGRAFLVRNFYEEAFAGNETVSHGDELQMLIVTRGIFGRGSPTWTAPVDIPLSGKISPTGFGEGYTVADRYRLEGKPLVAGRTRQAPDLDPTLAWFPATSISTNASPEE